MALPAITTVLTAPPAAPSRLAEPDVFETQVDDYLLAQANMITEQKALVVELNGWAAAVNSGGAPVAFVGSATFNMNLTTLATLTSTAFDVTITGLVSTDTLIVTPTVWSSNTAERAKINYSVWYINSNTCRVVVQNSSAAAATLGTGTWIVTAIRAFV